MDKLLKEFDIAMEKLLKEFDIPPKHCSEQKLNSWRNSVIPIKNRSRRFRFVADLDKRLEVKELREKISEKLQASIMLHMEVLDSIDAGDQLGSDLSHERDREAGIGIESQDDAEAKETVQVGTETECQIQAPTAGSGIQSSQLAAIMIL